LGTSRYDALAPMVHFEDPVSGEAGSRRLAPGIEAR
jgi:hypothetical protein